MAFVTKLFRGSSKKNDAPPSTPSPSSAPAEAMPKGYGQYPPYPDPFPGKGFPVRGPAGPSPNKGFSQKGGPAAPGYPGFVPSPVAYEGYQYQFSMHSMGPAGPVPGPGRPPAAGPGPVAAPQKVPPAAARTRKSMGPLMPPLPPSALRPDSPVLPEADDSLWPMPPASTSRSQVADVPSAAPAQPSQPSQPSQPVQATAPCLGTQPDRKSESTLEAPSSETHSSASAAPVMPVTEDSMPRMPAMPAAMPELVTPTPAVGMQASMSDQGLPKEAPAPATRPVDMPEPEPRSEPVDQPSPAAQAAQAAGGKPAEPAAPLLAMARPEPEQGLGAAAVCQGQDVSVTATSSFSEPSLSPSGALPAAERSSSRGGPSVQFAEGCEDTPRAVPSASRSGSRPTVTHLRSELERLQKEMEALRLQPTSTSSPDTAMREEELRLLREQLEETERENQALRAKQAEDPGPAPKRRGRKSLRKTMDLTAHRRISWQDLPEGERLPSEESDVDDDDDLEELLDLSAHRDP